MEDDWIISSLKSYKILHIFELPMPTRAFDWSSDGNVLYVGGSSLENSNEILELSVPEKILHPNNGLSSKRDFTFQRGGFSSAPICSLKCIHSLDKLAAVGFGEVVKIYSLNCQEKGVIKHLNDLRKWGLSFSSSQCYLCWNESHPSVVLCGSTVKTAALLDVEQDKIVYQCNTQAVAPLNGLSFASNSHKFFTLSNNGSIELWDPRMKALDCDSENNLDVDCGDSLNYAMDVYGSSCEDTKLACVSRQQKQIVFYELRQWKKPFASISLDLGPHTSDNKHLCVKFSPYNDNLLSISGLTKGVNIYKMDLPSKLDLVFTHIGHEADMIQRDGLVLTHSWHPKISKLLVSTSSDSSLHVWQWKQDKITQFDAITKSCII